MTTTTKKKNKLTPEERKRKNQERRYRIRINTIFNNAGFTQIPTRNKNFTFESRDGEIDNIFLFENIIVVLEDTVSKTAHIKDHLNKTAVFFSHIKKNAEQFIPFLDKTFDEFKKRKNAKYSSEDYKIMFVYSSLHPVDKSHLTPHNNLMYLSNANTLYFEALAKTIHRSARYELMKFLGLSLQDIGTSCGSSTKEYDGFVLPSSPSGFPKDHKIITFYIDPQSLLELGYVLRKDSWNDREGLYQRMLIPNKIKNMRSYLSSENRVYINNVIASLPDGVRFLDKATKKQLDSSTITKSTSITLQIPWQFNSIGIIDGQHRVFSYHEGSDNFEKTISIARNKQQLLVTGVVFPKRLNDTEKTKYEAKLFLEINDTQARTKGDLRQAIQTIVAPYSDLAIAKSIISSIAEKGPLEGILETHYFDVGKLKTTSIVSYGLRHIVSIDENSDHSFFIRWKHENKAKLLNEDDDLRNLYVDYCASSINNFINAFKSKVSPKGLWTTDRKKSKVLSITTINGLIYCLRLLIKENKLGDTKSYISKLSELNIDFTPGNFEYISSHWKALGEEIYNQCFKE